MTQASYKPIIALSNTEDRPLSFYESIDEAQNKMLRWLLAKDQFNNYLDKYVKSNWKRKIILWLIK